MRGTPAFITGSRAYGVQRLTGDSDLDVVVLCDEDTITELAWATGRGGAEDGYATESLRLVLDLPGDDGRPTRAPAKLDLILVSSLEAYKAWLDGTAECERLGIERGKPVTRAEAIAILDKHRERLGLDVHGEDCD